MAADLKTYEGDHVDVHWHKRLCIHVAECVAAENDLCDTGRRPWIDPSATGTGEVAEVVMRCPSGALAYTPKDGSASESPAPANEITVANNGPLYVRGELDIDGADEDMPGVRFRAALCRCGASKNKPFCDNSHERIEFRDRGAIGKPAPGELEGDGPLAIQASPNGPLVLKGPVTMRTAAGRIGWRGTKTALCRCGHSRTKPFCDGSHVQAGFEAE